MQGHATGKLGGCHAQAEGAGMLLQTVASGT